MTGVSGKGGKGEIESQSWNLAADGNSWFYKRATFVKNTENPDIATRISEQLSSKGGGISNSELTVLTSTSTTSQQEMGEGVHPPPNPGPQEKTVQAACATTH